MSVRQRVVEALEEIAVLLELAGENPFKTRAYANAARAVSGLTEDLAVMVESGRISEVKGIGTAIAEKIAILVCTGGLPYLEELRARVPAGLREWTRIPGLGPKKVRAIHEALGIATVDELEGAARDGRLRELPGFGTTSERRVLEGIARLRSVAGRFVQPVVQREAARLLARVRAVAGVARAEVCGSVRRRVETSKDIDIVAAAADPGAVMDAFSSDPEVVEIVGRGPTKCSVRLAGGPAADLRVVPDESFPFAVLYFTGSKAHNIAIRARAQDRGLRLNEYAFERESDGSRIACADEREIYRALDLEFIPPELREDAGEIEAAARGELPELVEPSDLCGVLHCHSDWSDGAASIEEMAEAALKRGLQYLGLCDHSKAAPYARGLDESRVRAQHAEIAALNRRFGKRFHVLKGIEVDILTDGDLDFSDDVLAEFDLVVASVHSRFSLSEAKQTARVMRALDNPYVDILGHPSGRLLLARDPYPMDLLAVVAHAAERGTAIEINAHPHRLDLDWRSLRYGKARGLRTAIDPDAHHPDGIDDMAYGLGVARKGWCSRADVLNAWPLERLLEWLALRRERALARARH